MPKIIFATDFSATAQKSAEYAGHLAIHLKKELVLFHAYLLQFAYTEGQIPMRNAEAVRHSAEQQMAVEQTRLAQLFPGLTIESRVVPGDFLPCLKREAADLKPDIILLGASRLEANAVLWGSMAVKALQSLHTPVLSIPANRTWRPIEHLGVALNYERAVSEEALEQVLAWQNRLQVRLTVLHIGQEGQTTLEPSESLKQRLASTQPQYASFSGGEKAWEQLSPFVEAHQIDWLIVLPGKYSGFKKLFHKSATRAFEKLSPVPILALHG